MIAPIIPQKPAIKKVPKTNPRNSGISFLFSLTPPYFMTISFNPQPTIDQLRHRNYIRPPGRRNSSLGVKRVLFLLHGIIRSVMVQRHLLQLLEMPKSRKRGVDRRSADRLLCSVGYDGALGSINLSSSRRNRGSFAVRLGVINNIVPGPDVH